MRASARLGIALSCACTTSAALAFVPNVGSGWGAVRPRQGIEGCTSSVIAGRHHGGSFMGAPIVRCGTVAGLRNARCGRSGRGRSMEMLLGLGTDTILGVGGPELVIILAVGYFVLGPVELFKLTKQAGVLVGQLRDIGLGTVTNLGNIMDEQVLQADQVASGVRPPGYVDPEQEYPSGLDDEYEDVTVDEYGRMVYDEEVRPPPTKVDEQEPFWEGWSADKLGLNGEEGPLKQASKFAEQLSGAVNQKVMELGDTAPTPGVEAANLEGAKEAVAATAAAAGGAAGIGMAQGWQPPSTEPGMDMELANDVPSELTIDEQFERLDTIAALEEERATTMQRLEARLEAKIGSMKNELLMLVDEDFQERRVKVDEQFAEKAKAKAAASAASEAKADVNTDREAASAGGEQR